MSSVKFFWGMFKATKTLQGRANVLGDKDRKGLKKQCLTSFGHEFEEKIEQILACEVLSCFVVKGTSTEVYFADETPILFTLHKKKSSPVFPTLITLWKFPNLVPSIVTQPNTPPFLLRGADLMLPGCILPKDVENFADLGDQMNINRVWSVRILGNQYPFAVGQILMDRQELSTATKGKLLEVQHIIGDVLFKHSKIQQSICPSGITLDPPSCLPHESDSEARITDNGDMKEVPKNVELTQEDLLGVPIQKSCSEEAIVQCTESRAEESNAKVEVDNGSLGNGEVHPELDSDENEDGSDLSLEDVSDSRTAAYDLVLEFCLYEVLLKQIGNDDTLPLNLSAIWGKVTQIMDKVVEQAPEAVEAAGTRRGISVKVRGLKSVGIKKSSWKNMKRFANHFKKSKIWVFKDIRGLLTVTKINRVHPVLKSHILLPETIVPYSSAVEVIVAPVTKAKTGVSKSVGRKAAVAPKLDPIVPLTVWQPTALAKDILITGGWTTARSILPLNEIREYLQSYLAMSWRKQHDFPELEAIKESTDSKEIDKIALDVPWIQIVAGDPKVLTLCTTKSERADFKETGHWTKTDEQVLMKFIGSAMKTLTLLVHQSSASRPLDELLGQEVGIIEAEAKITISTQKTKRFTRTRVAGIHDFPMIDPKQLAEKLQKACAASASVCELDEIKGKSKPLGVVVQGVFLNEVANVLETLYGLPSSLIDVRT